jgi:hypothetical protein
LRYRDDYFVGRCPGIVGVTGFLGCFGFFFSLLLRCCPLAMIVLLRLWWRHYGEERDRVEENEMSACPSLILRRSRLGTQAERQKRKG